MLLRSYLESATAIEVELLANASEPFKLSETVDGLFARLFVGQHEGHPVTALLCINTHQLYCGAVRAAMSGNHSAMFPVARACLESASYFFRMTEDATLVQTWIDRNQSKVARDECRRKFTSSVKDVAKSIENRMPGLGEIVTQLYDSAIDYGAHPNSMAVFRSVTVDDGGENWILGMDPYHEADDFEVHWSLLACIDIGMAALAILAIVILGDDESFWDAVREVSGERERLMRSLEAERPAKGFGRARG